MGKVQDGLAVRVGRRCPRRDSFPYLFSLSFSLSLSRARAIFLSFSLVFPSFPRLTDKHLLKYSNINLSRDDPNLCEPPVFHSPLAVTVNIGYNIMSFQAFSRKG